MATEKTNDESQVKVVVTAKIKDVLRVPAAALAARRARDVTQLVNDILLKALEEEGYFPTEQIVKRHEELVEKVAKMKQKRS